jgi:hypothetical protein
VKCVHATGLLLVAAVAPFVHAQPREVQHHDYGDPEGRLMAFYASALAVSAVGTSGAGSPWTIEAGLELSLIPRLSRAQRTAGFDKPESSNLSPVLPRARVSVSTPARLRFEVVWLPPVEVFDAEANLYAVSVSRSIDGPSRLLIVPRFTIASGRARGAITCNDALRSGTASEQVYYGAVCHARESEDSFEPDQLSGEVIISREVRRGIAPFISLGARRDDTRFDIGVRQSDGARDPDHPILVMRSVRPFMSSGVAWRAGRAAAGAEVYYAPGSLLTARVRMDVVVRAARGPRAD